MYILVSAQNTWNTVIHGLLLSYTVKTGIFLKFKSYTLLRSTFLNIKRLPYKMDTDIQ